MSPNLSDLPEKERMIVVQAGNSSPLARDMAQTEAIVRNTLETKKLIFTIKESNEKNDHQQKWFLVLSIISAIFAATGIIQAWDILARGIGK